MSETARGWHPGNKTAVRLLGGVAAAALFLLVHTYGISLLPSHQRILSPSQLQPDATQPSFAYHYHFREGVPDRVREMRSRLVLTEDGRPHTVRTTSLEEIARVGGDRYAQLADRIVFSTTDNSDPRTNGRIYAISWPWLYSDAIGRASAVALALAVAGLWWLRRKAPVASPPVIVSGGRGRWWWWLALAVFAAGLYCNTGTRAPYAITFAPMHVDPATGFLYNQDHVHFRVLFDFVDGQPREVWDRALFLRRILYPVICWPAMKLLGYETGGVVMNLLFGLGAFVGATWWLRRREGGRAEMMGAWLLAAYPGFAYWVGMPYQYALIAPGALMLTIALAEIDAGRSLRWTVGLALFMGVLYLAYDFGPIFLPATVGLLLWRRRWSHLLVAALAGALPLLCWLLFLRTVLGQSLENSNAGIYRSVLSGFLQIKDWGVWASGLPRLCDTLLASVFGANFVFLPAIFLGVLCLNSYTSRVRLAVSECAIMGSVLLLFAVVNLGTVEIGTWIMSGSWIARIYQPVFPVMVFFVARWWQALPALPAIGRVVLLAGLALATVGNLLVVFGPVAGNPGGVSGEAFFRFYTHSSSSRHGAYESCLKSTPPRLLGFGRPVPKEGR